MKHKCKRCGGEFEEFSRKTYYEDFGDVDTVQCPLCKAVLWDGMDYEQLFEDLEEKD